MLDGGVGNNKYCVGKEDFFFTVYDLRVPLARDEQK